MTLFLLPTLQGSIHIILVLFTIEEEKWSVVEWIMMVYSVAHYTSIRLYLYLIRKNVKEITNTVNLKGY